TEGKFKILSFRSQDTQFKPDPGVVPDADECEKAGITVVNTGFQHNDMRDTGPDAAKSSIQTMLDKFLEDTDSSALKPVPTKVPDVLTTSPGPVPLASNPAPANKPVAN
ncbi:MAG: alpha/beta hydrolase, partial [Bradyrhizobium sp.]